MYLNWIDQMISLDPLTSLNNRKQLNHNYEQWFKNRFDDEDLYLLLIDANKFKQINDTYGHIQGDAALVRIAEALRKACKGLPKRANIARYGGDEFVVLMESAGVNDAALALKQGIINELEALNDEANTPFRVTVSIGIAHASVGSSLKELISIADQEMYKEKSTRSQTLKGTPNFDCAKYQAIQFIQRDKIANTCAAFDTIGTFDYNAYYATYQTLETIDLTEDGFLQPDGTYRINIDDLDQLSCTQLKVIVSDDDTEVEKEYKIPIMVKTNSKTTDKIFTDEGSDCATCDVVVLAGKKLTVAGTESTNRDLKLYQGAELIIPEDSTYHLTSLSIQKYNDSVAALNVDGTLVVNKLYFDLYLTRGVWSYVVLPDTFMSRKVKFANGNVAEYGEDYSIGYYDGSYRAQYGRGGWKFASADQKFAPGIGFIISLNDNYKSKELRIELPVDSILGELHNKNITNLHSWSATAANDIGWNLVGNPYMAIYQSDLGDPIHIGELVQEDSDPWNGRWTYRGNSRYAVVPSTDPTDAPAGYYKSVLLSEHKLNPFTAFFVQLGGESNSTYGLNFHADHRANRAVRKVTETEESFLRIIIGDYKTGCFISDKFTDEYEPGDDLESNYPIYQEIGGYKLLYSAINDSILEAGINVYSNGGNVLLDNKTDINSFEYIYLNYENEWFDLLHENIVNIPGNFKLFGKRKRNLATDLEYIPTNGIFKFMKDGSVYINKNNQIFNILGQIQ